MVNRPSSICLVVLVRSLFAPRCDGVCTPYVVLWSHNFDSDFFSVRILEVECHAQFELLEIEPSLNDLDSLLSTLILFSSLSLRLAS
jgi:hypothetical protein